MNKLSNFLRAVLVLGAPALFLCILTTGKAVNTPKTIPPAFWSGKEAGEREIFGPIKIGIDLLRKHDIHDYNLNFSAFGPYQPLWEQRTIEGAWPIRFSTTSKNILSFPAMNKPGCRITDQSNGIFLYVCS